MTRLIRALVVANLVFAGGHCRAADTSCAIASARTVEAASLSAAPIRATLAERKLCFVGADAVLKYRPRMTMVDTRERATERLSGAINIPIGALAGSLMVTSGRPIVLVGDPAQLPELVERCADLRRSGHEAVRVLYGGIGSLPATRPAQRIDRDAPFLGPSDTARLIGAGTPILDDDELESSLVSRSSASTALHRVTVTPTRVVRADPDRLAPMGAALVVVRDERDTATWTRSLRDAGLTATFVRASELEALERYLASQAQLAVAARAPRPTRCDRY